MKAMPNSLRGERAMARRRNRELAEFQAWMRELKKKGKSKRGDNVVVMEVDDSVEGEEPTVEGSERLPCDGSERGDNDGSVGFGNDGPVRSGVGDGASVGLGVSDGAASVRIGVSVGSTVKIEEEYMKMVYEMWVNESDPDDPDFEEDEEDEEDDEVDETSEHWSFEEDEGVSQKRKRDVSEDEEEGVGMSKDSEANKGKGKNSEHWSFEEEEGVGRKRKRNVSEDEEEGVGVSKDSMAKKGKGKKVNKAKAAEAGVGMSKETKAKKGKGKKGNKSKPNAEPEVEPEVETKEVEENEIEDEEDLLDRFEYEVEEDVATFVDELSIGRREIPDSSSDEEDPMVVRNRRVRRGIGDKLRVGNSFLSKVEFKEAVLDYALSSGNNITQQKSEPKKVAFKCGMGGACKWRVYCSLDEAKKLWYVRTTYLHHSCTPNGKCRYIQAPVIARLFMDKLRLNPNFMPAQIQEHMKDQWKIVSTRPQCQGGRLKALADIEMEYESQYSHIRGYAEEILDSNPGSTAVVETVLNSDGQDVFQGIYICFDVIRRCWRGSFRPIIGLDGTFLKVAVKGCLLAAVGHDSNNQIYPIAWAVVQSETADNWLWFLKLLKKDLGLEDGTNLVVISDRGRGLLAAVKEELPNAEHRMCVKHIVENLKSRGLVGKDLLKPLVWKLAWSYTPTDFQENLGRIREYDMRLYDEVMKEKPETWSLAFYKLGSYCEDVDNNSTESFNASITKARARALIPMLETIRRQVMERISKRQKKSEKRTGRFTKYVAEILAEEKKDAERCKTYSGSHGLFEVFLDGQSYKVNIPKASCTCGKWQISGIPCEHAYGAMMDKNIDVEDHIALWFSTTMWQNNYSEDISPMRGPRFWMTSNYGLVIAPTPPTPPGRKKESKKQKTYPRIKGKHESPKKKSKKETMSRKGRIMHCKKCGVAGHNSAKCPLFPKDKQAKDKQPKKKKLKEVGSTSEEPPVTIHLTQPSQPTQTSD